MNDKLDQRLIAANLANDNIELIALYQHAAEISEAKGAVDETCFFLTQAYVFALQEGSPQSRQIKEKLVAHAREI